MKRFIKENWFKLGMMLILLLIGLSFGYYFVIFLPQKEMERKGLLKHEQLIKEVERQEAKQKEENSRVNLGTCLNDADKNYHETMINACQKYSGNISNCTIPLYLAKQYKEDQKNAKDVCFKRFPQANR